MGVGDEGGTWPGARWLRVLMRLWRETALRLVSPTERPNNTRGRWMPSEIRLAVCPLFRIFNPPEFNHPASVLRIAMLNYP